MKRILIGLGSLVFIFAVFANGQEDICKSCSTTIGCYTIPTGFCKCYFNREANLCSLSAYCVGNTCRGENKVNSSKSEVNSVNTRRWITVETLGDEIGKVDQTMGRLVSGLQAILRENATSDKEMQHLKLGMDTQEPAEGTYDPVHDSISLVYFVGDTKISKKLTFTSKEWKLESPGREIYKGSF